MSLTQTPLNLIRVIDPRVDIHETANRDYGIYEGSQEATYKKIVSSSYSDTQFSLSCNPPSDRIFVDRRVYIECKFQIDFTGTTVNNNQTLLQCAGLQTSTTPPSVNNAFYDAPRANPLAQATASAQVSLNNTQISSNVNTYFRALTRYQNDVENQNLFSSATPTMLDMSQEYADLDGFALSPLRGYGDNVAQCPRGGFVGCRVLTNTSSNPAGANTASVELTVIEPFVLSPFLMDKDVSGLGWIQLQTIDLLFQLNGRGNGPLGGLAGALWSHATGANVPTLTSATAHLLGAAAYFRYFTPNAGQLIPRSVFYNYAEPSLFPTTYNGIAVAPAASVSLEMNSISLKAVPNLMYVWVSERDADVGISTTDTYFSIENINVTFNNRDGILANASPIDLHQMAVRNGCNLSYRQFRQDVGSVLCIKFGDDIALSPLQSAGLRGNFNLSMRVTATNRNMSRSIIPTLNVLTSMEGVIEITDNSVSRSTGVLSEQNVLDAKSMDPVQAQLSKSVWGGSFWSKVGNFFKKAVRTGLDVGKQIVPILAPQYSGAVGVADSVARAVGVGKPSRRTRGKVRGGELITRSEMRDLAAY